jgi:hypothetical protein
MHVARSTWQRFSTGRGSSTSIKRGCEGRVLVMEQMISQWWCLQNQGPKKGSWQTGLLKLCDLCRSNLESTAGRESARARASQKLLGFNPTGDSPPTRTSPVFFAQLHPALSYIATYSKLMYQYVTWFKHLRCDPDVCPVTESWKGSVFLKSYVGGLSKCICILDQHQCWSNEVCVYI